MPLQHSECEGDLRLASSRRLALSQLSNAGSGSLSWRESFSQSSFFSGEENSFVPGSVDFFYCARMYV